MVVVSQADLVVEHVRYVGNVSVEGRPVAGQSALLPQVDIIGRPGVKITRGP